MEAKAMRRGFAGLKAVSKGTQGKDTDLGLDLIFYFA
jgi:hypothetical protein